MAVRVLFAFVLVLLLAGAPLRPGGQARFGAQVVEVRSQGEFVDTDRAVQVLGREGPNIIVRPLPEDA